MIPDILRIFPYFLIQIFLSFTVIKELWEALLQLVPDLRIREERAMFLQLKSKIHKMGKILLCPWCFGFCIWSSHPLTESLMKGRGQLLIVILEYTDFFFFFLLSSFFPPCIDREAKVFRVYRLWLMTNHKAVLRLLYFFSQSTSLHKSPLWPWYKPIRVSPSHAATAEIVWNVWLSLVLQWLLERLRSLETTGGQGGFKDQNR